MRKEKISYNTINGEYFNNAICRVTGDQCSIECKMCHHIATEGHEKSITGADGKEQLVSYKERKYTCSLEKVVTA